MGMVSSKLTYFGWKLKTYISSIENPQSKHGSRHDSHDCDHDITPHFYYEFLKEFFSRRSQ